MKRHLIGRRLKSERERTRIKQMSNFLLPNSFQKMTLFLAKESLLLYLHNCASLYKNDSNTYTMLFFFLLFKPAIINTVIICLIIYYTIYTILYYTFHSISAFHYLVHEANVIEPDLKGFQAIAHHRLCVLLRLLLVRGESPTQGTEHTVQRWPCTCAYNTVA